MAIKKKPPPPPVALRLELVDWLLEGHCRRPDERDPLRRDGVYDGFLEFDTPGPDLPALWRAHRTALLDEWARRGGRGRPWAAKQFDRKG